MSKLEEPVPPSAEPSPEANRPPAPEATLVSPELLADSLGAYARAWLARVRGGESGVLPVVGGLLLISILFQSLNSHFLTAANLVNLLVQGAVYMLLALAEIFVLLLGELDLSIGFVAGVGGVVAAELVKQSVGWPWWAAVIVALLVCTAIGTLQGTIITRFGLPAFVVTLAGQLGWQGFMLERLGKGGALPINESVINNITSGNLTPLATWVVMIALVVCFGAYMWFRDARRRRSGLVAPPTSLTVIKIVLVLLAGVAVVLLCNVNRGTIQPIRGAPWVLLLVLAVLTAATVMLNRTTFGRYIYAIGGNPEGARRAGVNLSLVRTAAFSITGFTAGIAGLVYASRLRSVSTALNGGQLVLYAVAAAVIGGTSLFGGRGKAVNAVLGGLVIAAIDNGMGLQGYSAQATYMVTALVLLVAVAIDSLARRGRAAR